MLRFFRVCLCVMARCALMLGLLLLLVLRLPAHAEEASDTQILVTVADDGAQTFARDYHRPGYTGSWSAHQTVESLERDYGFKQITGWPINALHVYCIVVQIANGDVAAQLAKLQSDRRVRLAQIMQTFKARGVHNDPYFALQYGRDAERIAQWHQRATGRGVRIAIVDTGIDRKHPDLAQRVSVSRNFVDGDTHFDSDIHGTAVAGIVAATADNNIGIVGVAPNANLFALKACWQPDTHAIDAFCNSLTLAKALSFAIDERADIINLSLGGPNDPLLTQLLEVALARGALVIAAQNPTDEFPAHVPGVIAVTDAADGPLIARLTEGDATALTANAKELLSTSPGGHYDFFSGSSMAAARVTGLSALMREQTHQLTAAQLLNDLNQWLAPTAVARSH